MRGTATPLSIALSAFDIATLIAVIGTLACRLVVAPQASDAPLARGLQRMQADALALLALASLGILLSRTLEMNGGVWTTLLPDVRIALAVTHFGHIWRWRVPALAVLWLGWAWHRRHPGPAPAADWIMLLAVAAVALTRSETGHPADHGDFTLAVWIDWLHLLAAATWVGSLFGMTRVVFPWLLRPAAPAIHAGAEVFQRLSTLSGAALGVLLACGIYNAFQQLGPVSSLWLSRYGITLDVKLALVLAMILIGAHNRYVKLPTLLHRAGRQPHPSSMRAAFRFIARARPARDDRAIIRTCARAVLLESVLGLAVIGATATLIHAMPPADMPAMPMQGGTHAAAAIVAMHAPD